MCRKLNARKFIGSKWDEKSDMFAEQVTISRCGAAYYLSNTRKTIAKSQVKFSGFACLNPVALLSVHSMSHILIWSYGWQGYDSHKLHEEDCK